MALQRMNHHRYAMTSRMESEQSKNRGKNYSPYTDDYQIATTSLDTSYAFGGKGETKIEVLSTQKINTGSKMIETTDFKITVKQFETGSKAMWDWIKDEISSKAKQIVRKPLSSCNLYFGMVTKPKSGDPEGMYNKIITSRADGSLDGYFANDWFQIKPIVAQVLDEFRRVAKLKGEREIAFYTTVDKSYFDSGVTTLPFEPDRARIIREATAAARNA